MTNAQNGVTMVARPHLSMGLRGADATPFAIRFWQRVAAMAVSYAITPVTGWLRLNREMAELGQMDARELRDMGVNHADFPAIREGTFHRTSVLSGERIVFNPESMRERNAEAEKQPMEFFAPFAPGENWYGKWWFGD